MRNLYWLTDEQMQRLRPFFPKSHGKPRVDDRRVLRRIVLINRNGLRWCDALREYGPPKTLHNRWKRWVEAVSATGSSEPARSDGFRETLKDKGIGPCIPGRKSRGRAVRYDRRRHRRSNRIEIMFRKLRDWRRIATRCDKGANAFHSAVAIAAADMFCL